jgi:hypothetical protein
MIGVVINMEKLDENALIGKHEILVGYTERGRLMSVVVDISKESNSLKFSHNTILKIPLKVEDVEFVTSMKEDARHETKCLKKMFKYYNMNSLRFSSSEVWRKYYEDDSAGLDAILDILPDFELNVLVKKFSSSGFVTSTKSLENIKFHNSDIRNDLFDPKKILNHHMFDILTYRYHIDGYQYDCNMATKGLNDFWINQISKAIQKDKEKTFEDIREEYIEYLSNMRLGNWKNIFYR